MDVAVYLVSRGVTPNIYVYIGNIDLSTGDRMELMLNPFARAYIHIICVHISASVAVVCSVVHGCARAYDIMREIMEGMVIVGEEERKTRKL